MFKLHNSTTAGANFCSAMGAETIQKTRVSVKNHKSSIKFLIFTALFTVMFAGFSSCKKDNADNDRARNALRTGSFSINVGYSF